MVGTYNDSLIHLKDERKLSYREYGDTNENTVIYFHGFGSSAGAIHPDPNILDEHTIRFFAINRPGYGESDLAADYSPEDFADTVNEFLMVKKIDKASIIGWSAGGLYSQVFAEKYPDRVSSLNLVSSAIPLNSKETRNILPSNWKMINSMNRYLPFLTKYFFKSLSKKLTKDLDSAIQESIKQMVEEDKIVANDPTMKPVIIRGAVESYHNRGLGVYSDARALCKNISTKAQPLLDTKVNIWQGSEDNVWTPAASEYLRQRYPASTYSFIEKEGHLLYLSHWNEILKKAVE
jgi:pimeloyl-ACP methyl ester carboxylesterase